MRQRGTFTNGKKGKSSKLLIKFGNDHNLVMRYENVATHG